VKTPRPRKKTGTYWRFSSCPCTNEGKKKSEEKENLDGGAKDGGGNGDGG